MGEDTGPATVEESTEPPICAQRNGKHHGPQTTTGHHPQARDEASPISLTAAHTLSAAQVAQELGVEISYGAHVQHWGRADY